MTLAGVVVGEEGESEVLVAVNEVVGEGEAPVLMLREETELVGEGVEEEEEEAEGGGARLFFFCQISSFFFPHC